MAAVAEINADVSTTLRLRTPYRRPHRPWRKNMLPLPTPPFAKAGAGMSLARSPPGAARKFCRSLERQRALLWYAFPHEGYEASDSVLYLGACPNQHLLPLFEHVLPRYGIRPLHHRLQLYLGWETGRIARELTQAAGGEVVSERFMPLGSEEVEHLIAEIRQKKPDFILSIWSAAPPTPSSAPMPSCAP